MIANNDFVCVVVALCAAGAAANEPSLTIGDPAPKLGEMDWLRGDPVGEFQPGNVYVLDFWTTWCGPCIEGMPYLSQLQKKYADRGVRIVGVSMKDHMNRLPIVRKFVERHERIMGYSVAHDTSEQVVQKSRT